MKNKIDERLIMRPAELKPILGLHSSTIWKMCRRGDLPTVKVGDRLYVLRRPFLKMLKGEQEKTA